MSEGNIKMAHLNDQNIAIAAELLAKNNRVAISNEISSHIEQCPLCMERVIDLAIMLQKAEKAGLVSLNEEPAKKSKPFTYYYMYFAAAGVATLLFSVIFCSSLVFDTTKSPSKMVVEEKIPFYEQIQKNYENASPLIASDSSDIAFTESQYSPSDIYEPMVGSYLRSVAVEVVAPKVGDTLKGKMVIFEWKNGTQDYTLKLYNNKGMQQAVFKSATTPFQTSLPVSNGLYYWTLESSEELIYIGKIYVVG